MRHLWQGVARRLAPALVAPLLLAGGSSLQAQPEGKPPDVPREPAPLQCWWRTSTPSVRVAEPFTVLLTCAVGGPQDVVVDQGNLEPEAIQLAPFEVLSGSETELRSSDHRFFQREYRLRILTDAAFGRDVLIPPVVITYRLQTRNSSGGTTEGIERRHELPGLPVRIVSLVPAGAGDIREPPPGSFAALEDARLQASLLTGTGGVLVVLGALGLVLSFAPVLRAKRQHGPKEQALVPDRRILQRVMRELADVRREREAGSWSDALIARTLAALRIAASYTTARGPALRLLEGDEPVAAGAVMTERRDGRRIAISAAVTPHTARSTHAPAQRSDAVQHALDAFSRASYGREQPAAAMLDGALETAEQVARELTRERGWPARLLAAAAWRVRASRLPWFH